MARFLERRWSSVKKNSKLISGFAEATRRIARKRLAARIAVHTLFQNDLYLSLAKHANQMAQSLQDALLSLGYPMLHTSPTNQIFPIVPKEQIKYFTSLCSHEIWDARPDGSAVVRLVTSWATEEETIQNFIKALSERREKTQRLP